MGKSDLRSSPIHGENADEEEDEESSSLGSLRETVVLQFLSHWL
jgi:hypothetical protein